MDDVDGPDTAGTNADLCPWVLTTDVLCADIPVQGAAGRTGGATRGPLRTDEGPGILAEAVVGFLQRGAAGPATSET